MAVDFSALIYAPNVDFWSRPITVSAIRSRGGAVYEARGIYGSRDALIQTDAGMAVISDQETILDIRERDPEFGSNPPTQGDIIDIPPDGEITEGAGTYEVTDLSHNGGGEITLVIRKLTSPTSIGP
jgi:hypothetical protein